MSLHLFQYNKQCHPQFFIRTSLPYPLLSIFSVFPLFPPMERAQWFLQSPVQSSASHLSGEWVLRWPFQKWQDLAKKLLHPNTSFLQHYCRLTLSGFPTSCGGSNLRCTEQPKAVQCCSTCPNTAFLPVVNGSVLGLLLPLNEPLYMNQCVHKHRDMVSGHGHDGSAVGLDDCSGLFSPLWFRDSMNIFVIMHTAEDSFICCSYHYSWLLRSSLVEFLMHLYFTTPSFYQINEKNFNWNQPKCFCSYGYEYLGAPSVSWLAECPCCAWWPCLAMCPLSFQKQSTPQHRTFHSYRQETPTPFLFA